MRDKIQFILSIIQTIVLILILVILISNNRQVYKKPSIRTHAESLVKIDKPVKLHESDAIWGDPKAPNTIVAYIDYQCPYCKEEYSNLKELKKEYINTGKLKIIFRDYPLRMHPNAQKLALTVECARQQDKFWEMADRILTSKEKGDDNEIQQWSQELNLDSVTFSRCMSDPATLAEITKDIEEARLYGIHGTPSLFINDIFSHGTLPAKDIIKILNGKMPVSKSGSGSCR